MKNIIVFLLFSVISLLVSCKKDEISYDQILPSSELIFTATIAETDTKTIVNMDKGSGDRGKINWVIGDRITVRATQSTTTKTAGYIVDTIDVDGKATFIKEYGDELPIDHDVTYSVTYGVAPTAQQNYTDHHIDTNFAKNLYMTAPSTNGTVLKFTVACGLLKLNLKAYEAELDKTISKIEITGTPVGGAKTTFTLNCDSGISISSATDFYIPLPAGSYTTMNLFNCNGYVCQKKAKSALAIMNNHVQPLTLTDIAFNLLPGKYRVNYLGKQVRFAKGNLIWNGVSWALEAEQTNCQTSWNSKHINHFFWTKTASASYASSYSDAQSTTDKLFCDGSDAKHMLTINGQSNLYALTDAEWKYLINKNITVRKDKYKIGATVNGVSGCLLIAPDDFDIAKWHTGTPISYTLEELAASQLVCLPPVGNRQGTTFYAYSSGFYWTAALESYSESRAQLLSFSQSSIDPIDNGPRLLGLPIRLVATAQ